MCGSLPKPSDILEILRSDLNIEVDDPLQELLESGLLDSLTLVQLIVTIENAYDVILPIDELEFDHFQNASSICMLVARARD